MKQPTTAATGSPRLVAVPDSRYSCIGGTPRPLEAGHPLSALGADLKVLVGGGSAAQEGEVSVREW